MEQPVSLGHDSSYETEIKATFQVALSNGKQAISATTGRSGLSSHLSNGRMSAKKKSSGKRVVLVNI